MPKLILVAPLAGWSTPLDEAPDAVFAGRMLGDGVAIDPIGATVYAPCDGELIAVPATKHAITLRAAGGAEILLHVGIDTVGLGGEGFELHVEQGQQVRAGDRLLSFDLDLLARRAKSVLTPVIVVDGAGFTINRRSGNRELKVGDFLMELEIAATDAAIAPDAGAAGARDARVIGASAVGEAASRSVFRRVRVALEHGIHARPAALLAAALKGLTVDVTVAAHGREASARSTIALMTLGVKKGDEVEIRAAGPDAAVAVAALERALVIAADAEGGVLRAPYAEPTQRSDGAEQRGAPAIPPSPPIPAPAYVALAPTPQLPNTLRGVIASRGLAVGLTLHFSRPEITVSESGAGVEHEKFELGRARDLVKARLRQVARSGSAAARDIVGAHLELLDDPELVDKAQLAVANGKSAGYAWRQVIRANVDALKSLDDARMAERVADLIDLESQVLEALDFQAANLRARDGGGHGVDGGIDGRADAGDDGRADRGVRRDALSVRAMPEKTILLAKELLPSQLVALDAARVAGICMAAGGATSHVAILAAALGIPVLVALGPTVLTVLDGTAVVLDAEQGLLKIAPGRDELVIAESELGRRLERRSAEQAAAQLDCRTADGTRIEVFANVGSLAEAEAAVRNGAEGCGLLRTEFLFLERQSPPDEAEQSAQYQGIATALGGRPLTIRTLDIGGDKPIPYLPMPHEDNPALGLRGVRTSLWSPDLLRVQLRAILAVRPDSQARILLPMITDPAEIRTVRAMLVEVSREVGRTAAIELGVMIETPAAAVMADRIAAAADFLSIGTNDLTQYTLAMDRGHPELAARLDALHPAVLRLIARTVSAAHQHGRRVAVCGGLASDPTAAPILIGLGVHELSAVPAVIPRLKALIGGISMEACCELARRALEEESADSVRALAVKMLSSPNPMAVLS